MLFTPDANLVEEHRQWLAGFTAQHLKNWEKLLNANAEAAMCEAEVRRLLQENGNTVEPNEELTGADQSPDFRCTQAGKVFFVEVTCISIDKATQVTGLSDQPDGKGHYYRPLNDAIFEACRQKTPQCSDTGCPVLVAVGTFHFRASAVCLGKPYLQMLLTGKELISHNIDMRTGEGVGDTYLSTKLYSAAFLRPDESSGLCHARNPVSGMLLCGFGGDPFLVRGVLHPSPVHEFDRALLPKVEFCRLRPGYDSGQLSTEWL